MMAVMPYSTAFCAFEVSGIFTPGAGAAAKKYEWLT